ncbi:MAG TPA: sugar-binding protein, partial [Draconibacterium sp.]|nr:sugar-binding protein [Draconibacterium sp.]
MRKFFTLFLGVMFFAGAIAQDERPEGTIMHTGENIPVIDGVLDENGAWDSAIVYNIDKALYGEAYTFGEPDETTWRALWNDDGMYIFLKTVDDAWYPSYATGGNSWEYDKPEIYFDVNYVLLDAGGPSASGTGHYQVAPAAEEAKIDGTPTTQDDGVVYAFLVDGTNWDVEYFVPWTLLKTSEDGLFDKTAPMGFDVTMIDRDPDDAGRRRAVWANIGGQNESWSNMDDVGYIYLDGAEPPVYVEDIILTL